MHCPLLLTIRTVKHGSCCLGFWSREDWGGNLHQDQSSSKESVSQAERGWLGWFWDDVQDRVQPRIYGYLSRVDTGIVIASLVGE